MTFNRKNTVEDWDELKPEGNSRDLYSKLSQKFKQDSSILIVGHEPYLSSLISEIISEDVTSHVVLKKAWTVTSHFLFNCVICKSDIGFKRLERFSLR